jgi:HK97 family phage major capsid protein
MSEINEKLAVEVKELSTLVSEVVNKAEAKSKETTAAMEAKMAELAAKIQEGSATEIAEAKAALQAQYDEFVTKGKPSVNTIQAKSLNEGINEVLKNYKFGPEGVDNELVEELRSGKRIKVHMPEIKSIFTADEAKAMGLTNNLSGDPVASYGPRQAILPSQKVNFRDLVPTLNTETGLYVFYKETATGNNIAKQSEGSTKGENTYALSETKVVQQYIAGFVNFTKQMATSLPWLQTTLPRMLMRDYYKKENALFYTAVTAAATADTSAETDNVKKMIDFITAQLDQNFDVSSIVVSNTDLGALVKSTYTNGYYAGAGLVQLPGQGITIMGVPVVGASWATTGQALLLDNNFIERVQVKGLAIELSYENGTNFEKNQVTARIEAQTEINLMLAESAALGTLA